MGGIILLTLGCCSDKIYIVAKPKSGVEVTFSSRVHMLKERTLTLEDTGEKP